MSRIGKKPISIPSGVKVALSGAVINVEGPKGKLSRSVHQDVSVEVGAEEILVKLGESAKGTAMQGLTRSLIANMVEGVTKGFEKVLEINGVGYRADLKGNVLNLSLGFSHPVEFSLPDGITAEVEKQTKVFVRGIDKELVGSTAAKIRSFREPEPYKGKGIKYADERIIRKAGKAGKK
ncbi:50S ribosomal protein L6 [Geothermobacter hydrogeniphilus]|uniref:Large ribosomal subunit protein uL6 n=1 Tax=Geothermobacter hydrogeniphilus TaxID=1969733 RepID=A0A2K2HE84_9BACT|nr:50S ribosomal protein L6 [Geothermobacter hydrogeniphilus]PNU21604.1 50S ribosomal protein L6 [Geothermobacter hydrogeniphilus]